LTFASQWVVFEQSNSVYFILRMVNQWFVNDMKLICNPVRAQWRRFHLQITFGIQINLLSMELKIFFS